MKKTLLILAGAALLAGLTGCASTKTTEKAADKVPVVIGAEGVPRPQWVLSGMESEDGFYAVGNGKMSSKTNSLKVAETNGRAELAIHVQTTIKAATTTYIEDTGVAKDNLTYLENAVVERTSAILQGSSRKDYWVDSDNTVYALMYLPYKAVVPAATNIMNEYSVDEKTKLTEQKVEEALKKYNLLGSE